MIVWACKIEALGSRIVPDFIGAVGFILVSEKMEEGVGTSG